MFEVVRYSICVCVLTYFIQSHGQIVKITQAGEVTIEQAPYKKVSTEVEVQVEGIKEREAPEQPIEQEIEPISLPEQPEEVCLFSTENRCTRVTFLTGNSGC